jgi:hypothetical protein
VAFASVINRINAACERTFGESCTLAGSPVVGIYQAPFVSEFGIGATDPTFRTRSVNVPATPYGASLVVPAVGSFIVRKHEPDGAGWSRLVLESV